jgi:hypothetical protein
LPQSGISDAAFVLQDGRKSENIYVGLEFIWEISG